MQIRGSTFKKPSDERVLEICEQYMRCPKRDLMEFCEDIRKELNIYGDLIESDPKDNESLTPAKRYVCNMTRTIVICMRLCLNSTLMERGIIVVGRPLPTISPNVSKYKKERIINEVNDEGKLCIINEGFLEKPPTMIENPTIFDPLDNRELLGMLKLSLNKNALSA
ncbi:MAG: hypothetical protein ACI9GH_000108 [Candidatus Paceibacteria bacterium]|jgi:hypothetical protein